MMRHFTAFAAALTVATAIVAAQEPQTPAAPAPPQPAISQVPAETPQNPSQKSSDVTLTGCLIQGSGPTVFVLDNAKLSPSESTEKGKAYMLASATEDLNFKAHLNHEVTITGSADSKVAAMPKPGQKSDDKDLPKLTAKSVTMISDKCTAAPSR